MKILIAEDDKTSRMILTAILKKWDYDPLVVVDGNQAWEILRSSGSPSLAILDWDMPGMNGLEICRRLRAHPADNPPYLIILTAKEETVDIVKGLDAGANDYISKPYKNDELLARIRVGQRMVALQTELVDARNALIHEATHDPLTGCLNRRAILSHLEAEMTRADRTHKCVSIGLCDIDYFKRINDTYGHQAGDEVLRKFVLTIQDCLRKYDRVGRYGGEEFLVIAPEVNGACQQVLYERLRQQIEALRIPGPSGDISVTVSIGVTLSRDDTAMEVLLNTADEALYQAKREGRNRVVYAGDSKEPGTG